VAIEGEIVVEASDELMAFVEEIRREILGIPGAIAALRAKYSDASGHVVLCGAGCVGRATLAAVKHIGIFIWPDVFADNKNSLWWTRIHGIPVTSPDAAAKRYPDATFVVCVQEAADAVAIRQQLADLGIKRIDSYHWLTPMPPEANSLESIWADEESRLECLAQLNLRLDWDAPLPPHHDLSDLYFPPDLFRLHDREVFVDCGAYDGDTFLEFRQRVDRLGPWYYFGIEPDEKNYELAAHYVENHPGNCIAGVIRAAVGNQSGRVSFHATGDCGSRVVEDGERRIRCIRLDDVSFSYAPTFVKLDIEGAELSALRGAEQLIRQHRPILAVCLYHNPQDLWEIPLWIDGLGVGYRLYLRRYAPYDGEVICYAVPPERTKGE
jgi:FkbM family methyltransferase